MDNLSSEENRKELIRLISYVRNDLEPFVVVLSERVKSLERALMESKKVPKKVKFDLTTLDVSDDED